MRYIKYCALILILYLLFRYDIFEFNKIKNILTVKLALLTASFTFINLLLVTFRWYLLVQCQKIKISFQSAFFYSLNGIFYNFVIPSSVGGDVVKIYQVVSQSPEQKLKAGFTVIMDRVIGLYSMLTMAFLVFFLFNQQIKQNTKLVQIYNFTWLVFLFSSLFFLFLFTSPFNYWVGQLLGKIPYLGLKIKEILKAFLLYKSHPLTLVLCFFLTIIAQFFAIAVFYFISLEVHEFYSLPIYFLVAPIGFIVSVVPLAPGGIGVGQMAFKFLFHVLSGGLYSGLSGVYGITFLQFWQFIQSGVITFLFSPKNK